MENEFIFPEANAVLDEATERHANVWPFMLEAIDMAHVAFERQRDFAADFVPSVPCLRRARNDINDDCWRFLRSIADPLIDEGLIYEFGNRDGGEVVVMPDGLHVRMKKGGPNGATSNYPTKKVEQMALATTQYALFPDATELDKYIADGLYLDVVYIAGESMSEYENVGLRFAMAGLSPFIVLDPPNQSQLQAISPIAAELATDARQRLLG